jgi:membrane-bound metal-dependent hydrolase YbcI (DUF457 family)
MDPLTHIVVGRALTAAAARDVRPQSLALGAAAVTGALCPDIDSIVAFAGWDRYLRVHQFGTHSLLGAVLVACSAAALVRLRSPRSGWLPLLGAAIGGALSHVALDLVSGAEIAIGWPLFERRISLPLVAMADPWLITVCVAGLLCVWRGRVPMRAAARLLIATVCLFLVFKGAMLASALVSTDVPRTTPNAVEARWGSFTEWTVYGRSADAVHATMVASSGAPGVLVMSEAVESDSPLVAASKSLDAVRNFLAVHEFAFPVVRTGKAAQVTVMWSDLRYCSPAPSPDSIRCDIWAGGVFDRSGRAVTQEVRVGGLIQRRRPPG